jgi:hypothetical protein
MRHLPLAPFLAGWMFLVPFATSAAAVSVEELFNLRANGLSDEILVALIEADGSVFRLSPEDVLILHKRGLGEKVILAMLASARRDGTGRDGLPSDAGAFPAAAGLVPVHQVPIHQVIVQQVQIPASPEQVIVHVPVAVPVPIAVPVEPVRPEKPVYWGFGGRLRPDAWQPAPGGEPRPTRPVAPR